MVPDKSLTALRPHFKRLREAGAPPAAAAALDPVLQVEGLLGRRERQVTFFGAFKAGKSTLLNAFIDSTILPTRVNRATGVVTRIRHAARPSASVLRRLPGDAAREEPITFEEVPKYILLDLSGDAVSSPGGVEEVSLRLPISFARNHCALVDTPGLLDQEELTARTMRELETTDLAVMVLAADKLLHAQEKAAAQRAHELLGGNIVFIVNRLNLVEEDDKEAVLSWARRTLQEVGNEIVGRPRIFITERKLNGAGGNGARRHGGFEGLGEFSRWLNELLDGGAGARLTALSRLSLLEHKLGRAGAALEAQRELAASEAARLSRQEAKSHAQRVQKFDAEVREVGQQLSALKGALGAHGEAFVTDCTSRVRRLMDGDSEWKTKMRGAFDAAVKQYAGKVRREVQGRLGGLKLDAPDFDAGAAGGGGVTVGEDPSSKYGAAVGAVLGMFFTFGLDGGLLGAGAGAWVSKKLFGVDVKQATLQKVTAAARAMLPALNKDATSYIGRAEALLASHARSRRPALRPSPNSKSAQESLRLYETLLAQCGEFRDAARRAKEKVAP